MDLACGHDDKFIIAVSVLWGEAISALETNHISAQYRHYSSLVPFSKVSSLRLKVAK